MNDEGYLRMAISGEMDIDAALQQIEASGGFPIDTGRGSFLFAFQCTEEGWMLAGDHEGWNGEAMHRAGNLCWIEKEIPAPTDSCYKFRLGDQWSADPMARRYNYDEYGEISYVRATEKHLERWDSLMNDRRIRVWVPENGQFDRTLYIHDGQNIYDPEAMWGGWRLQQSLPDGILAIAIDNNAERLHEYTHTADLINGVEIGGDADEYLLRIEQELRPRIEEIYGETSIKAVMGSSLGGLLAFYSIHQRPEAYNMAISLSGTMGWGSFALNNKTLIELFQEAGKHKNHLYLDSGGWGECKDTDGDGILDDGPGADNYCTNIQLRDVLLSLGYVMDVDLWHWYEPDAPHNEAAWAARVWRSLEKFSEISP